MKYSAGLLVQPRLVNHRSMAAIGSGQGLCATRVITALTVDGPEIVAVIHKILGQFAIADNFKGGKTGNLICSVDAETGRLGVAFGRAHGQRFLLTQFEHCPVTGRPLRGFQLPEWPAARRLALDAATIFPELPLLGHDIVITDDGPLFLEANTHWRISLPQLAVGGFRPVMKRLIPRLATPASRREAALSAIE